MMKVKNFAGTIVALANVVEKKLDDGAEELRRVYLSRYTCNQRNSSPELEMGKNPHCCIGFGSVRVLFSYTKYESSIWVWFWCAVSATFDSSFKVDCP